MQKNTENCSFSPLSAKQDKLIAALIAGNAIGVAASAAGISERTAYVWMRNETFQAAYQAAKKELFNEALQGLMLAVDSAISTLTSIMADTEQPAGTRVRCAQIILEQSIEVHRTNELEERLKELEEAVRDR